MIRTSKFWILIFSLLLILCGGATLFILKLEPAGTKVGIYQDGILIRTVDFVEGQEPYEFTISREGQENQVRVDEKGIRIISANCPDQTCVNHGYLRSGAPIVCLPHQVVIKWESDSDASEAVDAVTGR